MKNCIGDSNDQPQTADQTGPDQLQTADQTGPDQSQSADKTGPDQSQPADQTGPDQSPSANQSGLKGKTVVIFCATKNKTQLVSDLLNSCGIKAGCLREGEKRYKIIIYF